MKGIRPSGSTPLARSITIAGEHLQNRAGSIKKPILATDGKETCGGDPVSAAASLRHSSVGSAGMLPSTTNTTVSVSCSLMEKFAHSSNGFSRVAEERGKRPAPNAISVDVLGIDVADESQLREITAAGGGKYYSASNFAEIK